MAEPAFSMEANYAKGPFTWLRRLAASLFPLAIPATHLSLPSKFPITSLSLLPSTFYSFRPRKGTAGQHHSLDRLRLACATVTQPLGHSAR